MSETIGFIGTGTMGQPIAHNLLKAGYKLRVYNRDASKTEALVRAGAQRCEYPGDVAEAGGVVITMVANDAAVEEVTLGEHGLLARLGKQGLHICMATISTALAERLATLHTQQGSFYLSAPVFGRPIAAAEGKLWICFAGDPVAKERAHPILEKVSQSIFDFGPKQAHANLVKVCGNFLINSAMEGIAEVLTLAEKNGMNRSEVMNMFGQTMFACGVYQNYGRMIAEKNFTPVGFQMQLALKDNNLLRAAAEEARVPMPLASLNHDRLLSGIARGHGTEDWASLAQFVDEDADLSSSPSK